LRESIRRRKEEHSKKKSTVRYVIFNGKGLVRECVIIKKEEEHISFRGWGELVR